MRFFALLLLFAAHTAYADKVSNDIVKKADDIRNPSNSFRMTVHVESEEGNSVFEVMTKGKEKTLIKTLEPARDKGRNLLMLNEDMWAYVPNLKRAVRVSLNQKLTGQAANGDISRMRWAGDYEAVLESQTAKEWVLFLTALKKGLTYDKIKVTIAKDTFRPLKAAYLTPAGKPLKNAVFSEYKEMAGGVRPSQIRITDAVKVKDSSLIKITEMESQTFADSLFNQSSLAN